MNKNKVDKFVKNIFGEDDLNKEEVTLSEGVLLNGKHFIKSGTPIVIEENEISADSEKPEDKNLTNEQYFNLLQAHDWYYEYSDDFKVWKKGHNSDKEIENLSKGNPSFKEIKDKFIEYVNKNQKFPTSLNDLGL